MTSSLSIVSIIYLPVTHILNSPVLLWEQTHKHNCLQGISPKTVSGCLRLYPSKVNSWFSSPPNHSSSSRIPYLRDVYGIQTEDSCPTLSSLSPLPISNPCHILSLRSLESSHFMLPPPLTWESKPPLSLTWTTGVHVSSYALILLLFHILGQKQSFQNSKLSQFLA